MNIAVIGAGVSGLSIARMLSSGNKVRVFEKQSRPGGLIKCTMEEGNLYHLTGGHVFNSKRQDVLDWFWSLFNKETDFIPANRNVAIALDDTRIIGAPVENHVYQLDLLTQASVIRELLEIAMNPPAAVSNFDDFLKSRFGETLYRIYFGPYNRKIWRKSLKNVPLEWMEGKLPTPSIEDIFISNISRQGESNSFVHSSFFYPKVNGSQFIADTLAEGLDLSLDTDVTEIVKNGSRWVIGDEIFDKVVFCGNIKVLPSLLKKSGIRINDAEIQKLEYHGTTSVLCYVDANPYSWIYMPADDHEAHRIICTGNFSPLNSQPGRMSVTIEFSSVLGKNEILENLKKIPFCPKYITHHFEEYTYPMQNGMTREVIQQVREVVEPEGFYLLGRFAEWEYYNMDAAMGSALDLKKRIFS
ncbi:NAD(P)-binding protein [Akkermansia sp. N21169]|uniref:protoporphyrinogen/coproporphyrinogen oxidase n=1 Tax=Akkermansia sp. N21169 TaxID=3040765 RepID=UPI00244EF87F|nr:NAD(P)-binding protein [Akkermansia sp. N21169]MDH3068893.1 NAD(P)-binding protein [Akkermansia sp. N21169]